MSTSFKNVTPTGPGGTATLLIVLSFTGFLLLTQSLFVVPSGQVAVVTTATCPEGTTNNDWVSKRKPVKDNTINNVAVPPGPVGVTFLKDVDIKFILLINHI